MRSDIIIDGLAFALLCAVTVWLAAAILRAASLLITHLRPAALTTELIRGAGHLYARRVACLRWRVQAATASLTAALAALAGVLVSAGELPVPSGAAGIAIAAAAAVILLLIAVMAALRAMRMRRWQQQADARRLVAQHLHRIGAERDRLFHDVAVGDGSWIDHVLIGVQGAFAVAVVSLPTGRGGIAERQGDRLMLDDGGRYVDLAEVSQRVTRLQHTLSKTLGRMIRLRAVLALPGWRIRNNHGDDILIVGHRDIVMIRGWRNAADGLMNEDAEALQQWLETHTQARFDAADDALIAHQPVVQPGRRDARTQADLKAATTA